jgi:hypothetical protein
MPSIATPEEYLFDMDVDDEIMSEIDEHDTAYEEYVTYDEDMEAFEDEEFMRAYGFYDEDEHDDDY